MPSAFFRQQVAENFIKAAIETVELDHSGGVFTQCCTDLIVSLDANKSVVQFLTEILSLGKRAINFGATNEIVKKYIVQYGGEMLYQCLQASLFTLSGNLRYDVSNLIKSLILLDSTVSCLFQQPLIYVSSCLERIRMAELCN